MPRRTAIPFLPLILGVVGCGDSPVAAPSVPEHVDHVEAVVAGLVTDSNGNPVPGAYVDVKAICFIEPDHGCPMGQTGRTTDAEGRFLTLFELGLQTSHFVRVEVDVVPPEGMGYVLGTATIENLTGVYQPPPVSDTTFVRIELPPNSVESRRPIRVESGYLRVGLGGDAERFYLSSGGIVAVDPATGDCLWEKWTGGRAGPLYALLGDRVVIAAAGGLSVVRASDGEPLWSRDGVPNRTLTTSPDGLYATDGHLVMAFDPETGATRWTRELIGSGTVALAASAELVCAEILAYVECWEPATGERIWARPTEFGSWLAFAGPVVILGSQTGWTAMDAETGEPVWAAPIGSSPPPVFSEDEQHAFFCSNSACVAIRIVDGTLAWRTAFDLPVSAPAVEAGDLYVTVGVEWGSTSLYLLDAATGAIRERILPDPFYYGFCGNPVVTSRHLAILGCGSLYTFERS